MASDSFSDSLEHDCGEGSALFGIQPHFIEHSPYGAQAPLPSPYFPYSLLSSPEKVFKNWANLPDITLTYAPSEGTTTSDPALSPLLSELSSPSSSIHSEWYTPSRSFTLASIAPDMSPIALRTCDPTFDAFAPSPFSNPLSPLPSDPLSFPDNMWDKSPITAPADLPSLKHFPDFHWAPTLDPRHLNDDLGESLLTSDCVDIGDQHDNLEQTDVQTSPKRRRCESPILESMSAPAFAPPHRKSRRAPKQSASSGKATSAKTRSKFAAASSSSKLKSTTAIKELEFSPDRWLKLSPPSASASTASPPFHPPPSPWLSPSGTPDISNSRKRKYHNTSSLPDTPSVSPLSEMSSLNSGDRAGLSALGSVHGDYDRGDRDGEGGNVDDYIVAQALSQRRSARTKTSISYADCDDSGDDDFEPPARGKAKSVKAKVNVCPQAAPKSIQSDTGGKISSRNKIDTPCPFTIICTASFTRFSDVIRHLECNVLHTYVEPPHWQCRLCQVQLSRADSLKRHLRYNACEKRAPSKKIKHVYPAHVERELVRIRNSDDPAVLRAKERFPK
ncbi:hypothetical protein C0991_009645 [Blastosporella zonata]|nr:hypothetical protein C0991_009645 [Blastosporella zonata]